MVGIYEIKSPTNKVYIGQSWIINHRKGNYKHLRCADQPALYNSLIKHGFSNHIFKVVHQLPKDVTQEVLDRYEQIYIDFNKACGIKLLNIKDAGSHGKHSEETKEKLRKAFTGKPKSAQHIKNMTGKVGAKKGNPLSEANKIGISKALKGKPKNESWRFNLSKAKTGKPNLKLRGRIYSEEYKKKMSESKKGTNVGKDNPFFGKKHSPEVLAKIMETGFKKGNKPWSTGKKLGPMSEETKKKIIVARSWYKHTEETKSKMRHPHKMPLN